MNKIYILQQELVQLITFDGRIAQAAASHRLVRLDGVILADSIIYLFVVLITC